MGGTRTTGITVTNVLRVLRSKTGRVLPVLVQVYRVDTFLFVLLPVLVRYAGTVLEYHSIPNSNTLYSSILLLPTSTSTCNGTRY
jgi:hypothetical protein